MDEDLEKYSWHVAFCPSLNNEVNRLVKKMNRFGASPWPYYKIAGLVREKIKTKLVNIENVNFEFGFYCAFGNLYGKQVWFTNTYILDYAPVHFGENITIGPDVKIITSWHKLENLNIVKAKPIFIEDNVWITMNVIILPGVTIGKNSIIGAGSVVTKSVPPNSLVAGNPAKVIRAIDRSHPYWEDLEKDLLHRTSIAKKNNLLQQVLSFPSKVLLNVFRIILKKIL